MRSVPAAALNPAVQRPVSQHRDVQYLPIQHRVVPYLPIQHRVVPYLNVRCRRQVAAIALRRVTTAADATAAQTVALVIPCADQTAVCVLVVPVDVTVAIHRPTATTYFRTDVVQE